MMHEVEAMNARDTEEVKCRFSSECSFFQESMPDIPHMKEIFKMDFCYGCPEFCARHMLYAATGNDYLPEDLLPYEIERVKEIF
jgi:hypothetical protein